MKNVQYAAMLRCAAVDTHTQPAKKHDIIIMEYHESTFLIRNPEQILGKLSILLKKKCLITVCFGDNEDSFITTILDIYSKNNQLFFYYGPKEKLIGELLDSLTVTFKTEYLGVKVAFGTTQLTRVWHQGVMVFATPIPDSLLWVEARAFYRVKLPSKKPSYCQLTPPHQPPINLMVYDISVAGFSVLVKVETDGVAEMMVIGARFEHGKLILADTGEGAVSFDVLSEYIINTEGSTRVDKIGCKFTKISPAFENAIQRHMQKIERESRQQN
jgi:c-di-GMP-binding flagellar brake protein YcgR